MNQTPEPTNLPTELTQNKVYAVRREFFTAMERVWNEEPTRIDEIMGQSKFFIPPEQTEGADEGGFSLQGERICDIPKGLLMQSFLTSSEKGEAQAKTPPQTLRFFYSLFQAGDWLRFGILIRGKNNQSNNNQAGKQDQQSQQYDNLLNAKRQRELERIWDRPADVVSRGDDGLLLEWRFIEPEFYTNFAIRERFIQISRHLHFRLGWVIYNYLNEVEDRPDNCSNRTANDALDTMDTMDGADGGRLQIFLEEAEHPIK